MPRLSRMLRLSRLAPMVALTILTALPTTATFAQSQPAAQSPPSQGGDVSLAQKEEWARDAILDFIEGREPAAGRSVHRDSQ